MQSCRYRYTFYQAERSCFTIEQPRDTPMVFSYQVLDKGGEIGFDLYYGALATQDQHIMHKMLTGSSGHIDFVADNDGSYSYCVQLPPTVSEPALRLEMVLSYGFDSEYYEKLAKKYDYDAINLQVHKLNDMLTLTLNEADYQKHKEVEYHDVTEKMNNAALWWPVLQVTSHALCDYCFEISVTRICSIHSQIVILIIAGVYQVQHLKSFFKQNKLI